MRRLLIVRHGESIWNQDSKFTGWTNIPLTKKGEQEAEKIAKLIKQNNWKPSIIFSSSLQRAIKTGSIIKKQIYNYDIPMLTTWRLNEKHYGNLEGVEREYIRNKYGKKYTEKMRTNFFMLPPLLNDIPQYINGEYPIYTFHLICPFTAEFNSRLNSFCTCIHRENFIKTKIFRHKFLIRP